MPETVTPNAVELPPDYYLTNFLALVDFVWQRYQSLLSAQEQGFYRAFDNLDRPAQLLYIRLLSRKGALFRLGKLHYPEIDDLPVAVASLVGVGLVITDPELPLEEYLPLFTKAELLARSGLSQSPQYKGARREVLLAALRERGEESGAPLLDGETLIQVQGGECFDTFKLCFFGNMRQSLTDYVLRDLGIYRYERYDLDQSLPFQSRAQIEKYLDYYRCQECMDETLTAGVDEIIELAARLPVDSAGDVTLTRRLERSRLTLARQLERLQAYSEAENLYLRCHLPPARERRARLAVAQGRIDKGLQLCNDILKAPVNEEERVFAESFGYRTAKKHGQDWEVPDSYQPPSVTAVLAPGESNVEQLALQYLAREGACFYVENTLFNGVLGLWIWDIVFAPVAGAFFNPFQSGPADFYTSDFIHSRKASLQARLEAVVDDDFEARVLKVYRDKQGLLNPLVHWGALSEELLRLSLARIPRSHWQVVFERLLADLRYNRNGLPDLVVFPSEGNYRLVEVKGPGDRLQKNQLRWMQFFHRESIPHQVLHVRWTQMQ